MEPTSSTSPAAAVPVRTKIPVPMMAPIPKAVSDHGPSVLRRRCSGSSASASSLSMLLVRSKLVTRHSSLATALSPSRRRARAALLLDLRLAGAAGLRALGFGWPLLPCFAFQFLAFGVVFDFLSVHRDCRKIKFTIQLFQLPRG